MNKIASQAPVAEEVKKYKAFPDKIEYYCSNDYLNMGSIKGAISGVRYRKNDWSLIYTGLEALSGRLMALNCISVSTSYDQIIDHIVEFHVSQK